MTADNGHRPFDKRGETLRDRIEALLNRYRCQHTQDDAGNGSKLADVFTPLDHIDIRSGKEEVHLLADMLAAELSASSAEQPKLTYDKATRTIKDRRSGRERRRLAPNAVGPTTATPGVKITMRLKQQRDEVAEVLRMAMADYDNCGELLQATLDRARAILAVVPSYEQQLRNIFDAVAEADK